MKNRDFRQNIQPLDYWKNSNKPSNRMLCAMTDIDSAAFIIEITPIDLSNDSPCPLCGCSKSQSS